MKRGVFQRLSLAILLVVFLLVFSAAGVFAGGEKGMGLRQSGSLSQFCSVPYNIEDYGYTTGLHIATNKDADEEFVLEFYCGGNAYKTVELTVPPRGWTGKASDLLGGAKLRFPTLIYIHARHDPDYIEEAEKFWVTQFLFTGSGFSHVILESVPYDD